MTPDRREGARLSLRLPILVAALALSAQLLPSPKPASVNTGLDSELVPWQHCRIHQRGEIEWSCHWKVREF